MSRLTSSLALVLAAMATPAVAADWSEDWAGETDMRGGYFHEPKDWSGLGDEDDSIAIETGVRYWYSWGSQDHNIGSDNFTTTDNAHTGELHLRIDDYQSRSYVKAWAGYSAAINGSYDSPIGSGDIVDGQIGYAGADFGWNVLGDGRGSGLGGLVGYAYWNDSPRTDRVSFSTATSGDDVTFNEDTGIINFPGDSTDSNIDLHMLRLGVSGKADFSDGLFDISGEVAAVPYAAINGVIGNHGISSGGLTPAGNPNFVKTSETNIAGWGYGGMAEVMVGVQPIENLTFRIGGRAWYVQGTYDATYSAAQVTDPTDSDALEDPDFDTAPTLANQNYIVTANPFSMLRYGLLAELTYKF
ncbi:hypothetical protein [Devosia sp.]|uniref:hypothetical protein n=1 Tax=Devosia sp. TaxID=1871048 RepID=UPI003A8EA734